MIIRTGCVSEPAVLTTGVYCPCFCVFALVVYCHTRMFRHWVLKGLVVPESDKYALPEAELVICRSKTKHGTHQTTTSLLICTNTDFESKNSLRGGVTNYQIYDVYIN